MDWLKDYRRLIRNEVPRLQAAGLSFLGEDDSCMKFMDHKVAFTFSVEPFSDALSVLVRFLSDEHPDDEIYALHIIMTLVYGRSLANSFQVKVQQDRERIVKAYVEFILQNRQSLFGEVFPLAEQYRNAREVAAARIAAMFEQNAPPQPKE